MYFEKKVRMRKKRTKKNEKHTHKQSGDPVKIGTVVNKWRGRAEDRQGEKQLRGEQHGKHKEKSKTCEKVGLICLSVCVGVIPLVHGQKAKESKN